MAIPTPMSKVIPVNLDFKNSSISNWKPFNTGMGFWTNDIGTAFLEFSTELDLTGTVASIVLENQYDKSLVQKTITEITSSPFYYQLGDEIQHEGRWFVQISVKKGEETIVSNSFAFMVNASIGHGKVARLVSIETFETLATQLTALQTDISNYLETAETNEAIRVSTYDEIVLAEETRKESEDIREENDISRGATATADNTRANTDHSTAVLDHSTALTDHSTSTTDHTTALADHSIASSDHSTAVTDHTRANTDHITALADHTSYEGLLTDGVLATNIENKLLYLEETYAPNMVSLTSQLADIETTKAEQSALLVERARIDSFTTLAAGSTTGDAELIDGRIGVDGTTYANIGSAVRGQITGLDENLDVVLKEKYNTLLSTIKTQSVPPLLQSGTEGMMIRVSNPKTNIYGVKAWFKVNQAGNVVVGIGNGDKIYDSAIKYFHEDGSGVANIFETSCVLNITADEVGKVIEKYFEFDNPYNVAYENLNIGLWGLGLAYTQTWLSKSQSEIIMDFSNLTIDAEHGRYAIHTAYGDFYINGGVANSDILPAISLIDEVKILDVDCIENGSINKEKLNTAISGELDKINLLDSYTGAIANITKINNSILSSTVTAMPNELSQAGWNGKVVRMKNPKTKIHGVKVLDNDDVRTLYIGIGNGDNNLSGTIYLDGYQTVFENIYSFDVSQAESTSLFERYIEFDEPLIIDSESLFVGFWGWSSDKSHMLNCNLDGQLMYRNDDDITYSAEHPHYMVHYHTEADVYYIQGTDDSSQMPVIQLIGEDYVVPYSKITNDIIENPLSKLDYSEDFASIFDTIACIGDSLTEGAVEYSTQGTDPDRFPFSYPGQIQKRLNNKVFNFGHSGASTRTWNETATIRGYFTNEEYKAKAYIIALGTNDLGIEGVFDGAVGTDIDVENYNNNADTSVGNYAKIIQRIREFQPRARIFVMTLPHTRNTFSSVKAASEKIRQIAELLNCNVIDLEKYYVRPTDAEEFRNKYYKGGHLNTVGYKYFSNVVVTYLNYIIEQDPYSFWDVSLIGTDLI